MPKVRFMASQCRVASRLTTDYTTRIYGLSCSWVGLWRIPSLLEGTECSDVLAFVSCSGRAAKGRESFSAFIETLHGCTFVMLGAGTF